MKELEEGENNLGFSAQAFKMRHAYTDHGYRVTLEGKTIAYSGDSGICENSKLLSKDADLLIHESSYVKVPLDENWGHVDSRQAATLAKESNVKQLILTHFDASEFTSLDQRKEAEKQAQEIFPNTTAAEDDLVITI